MGDTPPAEHTKTKFGIRGRVADVVICFKFYPNRFRGFRAVRGQKWLSSIDFNSCHYHRSAPPCCLRGRMSRQYIYTPSFINVSWIVSVLASTHRWNRQTDGQTDRQMERLQTTSASLSVSSADNKRMMIATNGLDKLLDRDTLQLRW